LLFFNYYKAVKITLLFQWEGFEPPNPWLRHCFQATLKNSLILTSLSLAPPSASVSSDFVALYKSVLSFVIILTD